RPEWHAEGSPYRTHEGRGAHQAELDEAIGRWTSTRTAADLLAALDAAGVPAGRIYTAADIASDPHFHARGMIRRVPDRNLDGEEVPMQGVVPRMSGTPGDIREGAPLLGEHNDAVWAPL